MDSSHSSSVVQPAAMDQASSSTTMGDNILGPIRQNENNFQICRIFRLNSIEAYGREVLYHGRLFNSVSRDEFNATLRLLHVGIENAKTADSLPPLPENAVSRPKTTNELWQIRHDQIEYDVAQVVFAVATCKEFWGFMGYFRASNAACRLREIEAAQRFWHNVHAKGMQMGGPISLGHIPVGPFEPMPELLVSKDIAPMTQEEYRLSGFNEAGTTASTTPSETTESPRATSPVTQTTSPPTTRPASPLPKKPTLTAAEKEERRRRYISNSLKVKKRTPIPHFPGSDGEWYDWADEVEDSSQF